ncbi:hypothetical protein [Spiroplasma sp. AdecLV25b]|uniref:hypothetical protein n=1 Tax=Spiroplasma sp. AdecLV25b TaxID=3027162 RepID=UPI0027DFEEE5|nr:hypothetical protein [Spiroplasma sp. AdecLV25b]
MEKQIIGQQNNTTNIDPTTEVVTTVVRNNIKGFIRGGIIISSTLMSITFIVGWILWLTVFKSNIEEIITIVNTVITKKGINFDITFQNLTIAILGLAIVTLGITTFPFIFLKKKSIVTLILGILMLVISTLLITGAVLFGIFGYCEFYNYVVNKDNIVDILFFAIPIGLEMLYCVVLVIFCTLLIFTSFRNKKKMFELEIPVVNKAKENKSLVSQGMSLFSEPSSQPIPFVEPKAEMVATDANHITSGQSSPSTPVGQQGINIVITNNSSLPQSPTQSPVPVIPIVPNTPVFNQQPPSQPSVAVPNTPVSNQQSSQPVLATGEMVWSSQQIEEVWNKGEIIPNFNPSLYRKDYAGALMYKNSFLNHVRLNDDIKSFNWTIIHQKPLSSGGTNTISNLVPLNNTNTISKANNYPKWKTTVTYNGKENVFKEKSWKDKK